MCLFSFKVSSPICKVTISILSILYLRSHMFWFCCGTGTLTSKGCLKKRHKISVWTEENRHNTSKSVGMSVDLAAKLWSSSSIHNHKVCSNYSCHARQENTLKHITLEHDVCLSVHRFICVIKKKPTRCHWMVYCTYDMLNMFRALLCPSPGARDYMYVITAHGVQCLVAGCRGSGAGSRQWVQEEGCCSSNQQPSTAHHRQ